MKGSRSAEGEDAPREPQPLVGERPDFSAGGAGSPGRLPHRRRDAGREGTQTQEGGVDERSVKSWEKRRDLGVGNGFLDVTPTAPAARQQTVNWTDVTDTQAWPSEGLVLEGSRLLAGGDIPRHVSEKG